MAVDNYGNQIYPGSEDGGATDTEYTPKPERVICAAEERHVDHEARIAALELQRHRLPNAALRAPEAGYAHIPTAEWEDICAELEGLRTKWDAIPWAALRDTDIFDSSATIGAWLRANAPKEATE